MLEITSWLANSNQRRFILICISFIISSQLSANCNHSLSKLLTDKIVEPQELVEEVSKYFSRDGWINSASFRWTLAKTYTKYGPEDLFENALNEFEHYPESKGQHRRKDEAIEREIKYLNEEPRVRELVSHTYNNLMARNRDYYTESFEKIIQEHDLLTPRLFFWIGLPFAVGPIFEMIFFPSESCPFPTVLGPLGPLIVGGAIMAWQAELAYHRTSIDTRKSLAALKPILLDERAHWRLTETLNRIAETHNSRIGSIIHVRGK